MSTSVQYQYRPIAVDDAELRTVAELFRLVFPEGTLSFDYLAWLYRDNPQGTVIGMNAWSNETLAAHYAVIPIAVEFRGRPVRAVLSLNTATHPDHRGVGLFTRLAEMTYEVARQAGAHHVVGVANANSTPGFLTKLRFTLVTPLDARLHWRAPRLVDTATPLSWRREWSSDDLAWRFANPAARYFRRGNTVFSPTHIPGISATMRLECDVAVERGRFTGIGLWIGTSPGVYFPAAGGVAVPERFRKSPLNLIFRPLQDFTDVLERGGVHFEALDFDAY